MIESTHVNASSYDVGSPTFVKKIPGEYLSSGRDSRSERLGTTRLAGSSLMIISWVADPLYGLLHRLLSDSAGPIEAVCNVAALVCRVGPSRGVKTSEKVSLLVRTRS